MKVIGVISFLGTVLDYVCHPGAIINSAPFHFHKWNNHTSLDGYLQGYPVLILPHSNDHCLVVLYIYFSSLNTSNSSCTKMEPSHCFLWTRRISHNASSLWLDFSHSGPSGPLDLGSPSDFPETALPPVPLLSGRKPEKTGVRTYHVQRPAALMDAVCVQHHSCPPENPEICRWHNHMVRRLSQREHKILLYGPRSWGKNDVVFTL